MKEQIKNLISAIVITYGRIDNLMDCLSSIIQQDYKNFEIILVDNNEDKKISEHIIKLIENNKDERIKYFKTSKNLGVAGGRNFGIQKAKGDKLVFIDDDAFLKDKSAFYKINKKFFQNDELGILSFKIVNYFSRKIERKEFPHKNKKLNPNNEVETTYFIGAGHAIKKEVFNKIGLYPEDFFYGMEELDLSFKILDAGYEIFYFPQVVVFHKKSTEGRLKDKEMWQKILENRIRVSIRNLPWRYVIISSIIWMGKVFLETKGDIRIIFITLKKLMESRKKLRKERSVISPTAIKKLRKLQGRLCY